MKSLFFILCFPIILSAQKKIDYSTPPNCKKINDSLFIDKTEIRNIDWFEFLTHLKKDSSASFHLAAIPDTTVWKNYDKTNLKAGNYLKAISHRYYPVVGISYLQAQNYCKWRSDYINKYYSIQTKKFLRFRLPKESEWEFAASGGLSVQDFQFGYESYQQKPNLDNNPKKYFQLVADTSKLSFDSFSRVFSHLMTSKSETIFNVLHPIYGNLLYGSKEPLSTVNKSNNTNRLADFNKSMRPNRFGLTDTIGNVAEMVEEEGIAKGGSWAHTLEQSKILNRQYYTKPEAWLGFRCVCEVKSK